MIEQTKLFDDKLFIDKTTALSVVARWVRAFQKYCDSDEVFEESGRNGINACGYGIQCDECITEEKYQCAKAMLRYCKNKDLQIDYTNTSVEYFRDLLLGGKNVGNRNNTNKNT